MHFVSYSRIDGTSFAKRLAQALEQGAPPVAVWLDQERIQPGRRWDSEIDAAIADCETFLFVMTQDSVHEDSSCRLEVRQALRYKKPIIPLRVDPEVEPPFLLAGRQWIDFTGDFDAGLSRLHADLVRLQSPEGQLWQLQYRLRDAERDLIRASPQRERRLLELEVAQLREEMSALEQIQQNPDQAKRRAEERIQRALEQERHAEAPQASTTKQRTIVSARPPSVPYGYFQDRTVEMESLAELLRNEAVRLITVAGPAGVGKTTLVWRLLAAAEDDTVGGSSLGVDGVVWLNPTTSRPPTAMVLLESLSRLLPDTVAEPLRLILHDSQAPLQWRLRELLATLRNSRTVVVLDDAHELLTPAADRLRDAELEQALQALLEVPRDDVKVILITRLAQRSLQLAKPDQQRVLTVEGLPAPYAEDLLRSLDADGLTGLDSAPAELLTRARELTGGLPGALEALYAVLRADPLTSLAELLDEGSELRPEDFLVRPVLARLDPTARHAVEALAVYEQGVRPEAVDYLLLPYQPGLDSRPVLDRLVDMNVARRDGEYYDLSPSIDHRYVLGRIPKGRRSDRYQADSPPFTQVALLHRAVDFLRRAGAPDEEVWKLEDQEVALTESGLLAGYVADTVTGDDRLGIHDDVNALCSVLAARDVEPPLSVGLFGDWGSGKSFFMEQMRKRIRQLAKRSRSARRSAYCSEIRQITFNAWHYADANLWASLVTHIFDCLASTEPEDPYEADSHAKLHVDKERSKLLSKITTVRQERERIASLSEQLAVQQETFRREKVKRLLLSMPREAAQEIQDLSWLQDNLKDGKLQDPTVHDIQQAAAEYQGIWNKLKEVWDQLAELRRTGWAITLAASAVVLLAVGVVWLASSPSVWPVLGGWVLWLTGCIRVLKKPITLTLEAGKRVGNIARRLEEQQDNARKPIEAVRREAENHISALDEEINALQQQMADLSWGHQLYRFAEERGTSSDYRQQLGVVAMIRQDFEHMSMLLRRSRNEDADDGLRKVDRIILYIDDLDRCPAPRVVQVLEAVHLLLAVDLFVVVVGVDSRWLLRSLEHRYADLLRAPDAHHSLDPEDAADWASTPMNYLEKIFQIPYTLRPMESHGYGRLIDALMQDRHTASLSDVEAAESVKQPEHEEQIIAPSASSASPRDALPDDTPQPEQSKKPLQPDQREEIDLAPVLLQITEQELEFMKRVGPMISTPRAAKRFSNIYRLLRASMDPADLDRYLGADDADAEYQVVLLLLALLVGFPQQAAVIFDELRTATDFATWWEFVKDLQSRSGGAASHGAAQIKVGSAEATKWNRLFRRIDELQSKQLTVPEDLDLFRRWMPQVARFSFQTGHLMATRQRDSASAASGHNA